MNDKIAKKLANMIQRAKKLGSKAVVVGISSGNEGEHDHITNAELGMIHEFGSPSQGIPERSFMRSTLSEESGNLGRLSSKQIASYLRGEISLEKAYTDIGVYLWGKVTDKITDGDLTPNTEATKKRKIKKAGSLKGKRVDSNASRPLMDTGDFYNSITYEVRDNDS